MTPPLAQAFRFDRERRAHLLRHGLLTMAFNTLIGLALWLTRGSPLDVNLVYSHAIGLSIWCLCDFGRFLFPVDPRTRWPRGWRLWVLLGLSVGLGYINGIVIGNAYAGRNALAAQWDEPRRLTSFLITSLAISGGVTFFFYAQGRANAQRALLEEAERAAAETRLKLLESQLQPHMLFNTLANLRVLIGIDPARAQAMLDDLNTFLRSTLMASRATQHPLAAEFERLRSYLALMQVRMGERLQCELQLPADLQDVTVPPLLLQPLVENALQHGLEPKVGRGRLAVSATHANGRLLLQVRDTGVGLAAHGNERVGLSLVRERLAAVYGPSATLTLQPAHDADGGTLACIDLPCPS